ncbi:endonuclease MutS2 [Mycoplasmatota bacterium WC44]
MYADKKVLEFDKVLSIINEHAVSDLAKEAVQGLTPNNEVFEVNELLSKTDEALTLLYKLGSAPLGNVYNIYPHLRRVDLDGVLSAKEIREIAMHLLAVNNNKNFLLRAESENIEVKYYKEQVDEMFYAKDLYQNINQCVDEDCRILDSASLKLSGIRSKIKTSQARIEEKLSSILSKSANMLTDGIITRRNDRYVVPVKPEYKNKFKGIVQDYSASGETVFIEPQPIVDLTNKIQLLRSEENKEIERILIQLSSEVKVYTVNLRENLEILVDIDLTFAKAKFARIYNCVLPKIGDTANLIQARHPLLPQDDVVANNIYFNNYRVIIITGPNTGGKTVALKTLGLLSIMAQCGILIPVKEGSEIILFDNVFADIGDEQSIEQSLSTFSSHMTNLISITEKLTTNSLVLMDELGSGTDPKEGASLAIAILDYIRVRGCYIMATTHYPELKAYAYNNKDIVNASTEFNVDTLSPTYKLSIGIPGRSNAFEISKRLGLNERIISSAQESIETSNTEVSELINKLEDQSRFLEKRIVSYEEDSLSLKASKDELNKKIQELENENTKLKVKAKEEALEIIRKAKEESQIIIDQLLEYKEDIKMHRLVEQKTALKSLGEQFGEEKKIVKKEYNLGVGDKVKVLSYGQSATITKIKANNMYEVKMGILNTTVNKKELELIEKKQIKKQKSIVTYSGKKSIKLELDLRGYRFEDAMIEVDKYVDDLIVTKLKQATIIHGHGTNALKKGVHEVLKKNKYVTSYHYGKEGEGGSGVTVIYLD